MLKKILKVLGYIWAAPLTILATIALAAGGCRVVGVRRGHLDFVVGDAWFWKWWMVKVLGVAGGAFGHVIVFTDLGDYEEVALVTHEERHILQCEIFGVLVIPMYLVGLAIGFFRGILQKKGFGEAYRLNPLEVDAYAHQRYSW